MTLIQHSFEEILYFFLDEKVVHSINVNDIVMLKVYNRNFLFSSVLF